MRLITYRGKRVALVVHGDLAVFDPDLMGRGWGDSVLRFGTAMCRFAMEVELGLEYGPYDDERAEGFAREALMPVDCFAALAGLPDPYLAACFGVPAEQVPMRRSELGLTRLNGGADGRLA